MAYRRSEVVVKIMVTLATTVALVGPAHAGGAEIPRVYRGEWCKPGVNPTPFWSPGRCSGKKNQLIKITAHNLNTITGLDSTCWVDAIKPDAGPSHLITFRCAYNEDGALSTVTAGSSSSPALATAGRVRGCTSTR